jgi:hypothetical protein
MSTPVIDQKARDMAQAAASAIDSHEKVCIERWGAAMATMKDIKKSTDGLYTRFWVAAVSTITMLAGACLTLIYMVIHQHP